MGPNPKETGMPESMERTASALWTGSLRDGRGGISTQSGVLNNRQYGFRTRFEDGPGTNPEELIAAAHAGCFTMAVASYLEKAGVTADNLWTVATVTLEKTGESFAITAVHLDLAARIPGADRSVFEAATSKAKAECPVSKVLNARITLETRLES